MHAKWKGLVKMLKRQPHWLDMQSTNFSSYPLFRSCKYVHYFDWRKRLTVNKAWTPWRFSWLHDSGNTSGKDFFSSCWMPVMEPRKPGISLSPSSVSKWNPTKKQWRWSLTQPAENGNSHFYCDRMWTQNQYTLNSCMIS